MKTKIALNYSKVISVLCLLPPLSFSSRSSWKYLLPILLALCFATPTYAVTYYFHDVDAQAHAACDAEAASRPYVSPYGWGCYWQRTSQYYPGSAAWYVRWAPGGNYPEGWDISFHFYPENPCLPRQGYASTGTCIDGLDNHEMVPDKHSGAPICGGVGNPCDPASSNKFQNELDFSGGIGVPVIERYYNSSLAGTAYLTGNGWLGTHVPRIEQITSNRILVRRPDGKGIAFGQKGDNNWFSDFDINMALNITGGIYNLTLRDGAVERYYPNTGMPASITNPAGQQTTWSIYAEDRIASITGPFGHRLAVTYDGHARLNSITDPSGQTIFYTYTSSSTGWNLTRVDYPDKTAKIYHYNEPSLTNGADLPNSLTGISYATVNTDGSLSNVTRYASYGYDISGKAILTQHATTTNNSPQEKFTFAYDVPEICNILAI